MLVPDLLRGALASSWAIAALEAAVAVSAALLAAGGGRPRRALALALAAAALGVGLLAPADAPVLRAALALTGLLCFGRVIDLLRDGRPWTAAHRLWLVTAIVDTRRATRAPAALDPRLAGAALGYTALAAAGFWLALTEAERHDGSARLALRWAGGAVFAYAAIDAASAALVALYRALGIVVPAFHRAPILSRSVQEFWGERWNLAVGEWLNRHCFLPLARRRRPLLGVALAFLTSAAIHFWFVFVPLGAALAGVISAFFLLQAALVVLERVIQVRRWPPVLAHAWTVFAVLGPSPLFVEPILRIFGPG